MKSKRATNGAEAAVTRYSHEALSFRPTRLSPMHVDKRRKGRMATLQSDRPVTTVDSKTYMHTGRIVRPPTYALPLFED